MSEQINHCHPSVDLQPALSLSVTLVQGVCVRACGTEFYVKNPILPGAAQATQVGSVSVCAGISQRYGTGF